MDTGKITPLILTFNEEANIGRVLDRLTWAERVVVVDSFSTDGTLEILSRYPNVDVYPRYFNTFARQWNYGLRQVETEWVLSLDADYVCSESLLDEIQALPEHPAPNGFETGFRYCVFGKALRGTLYPPRTVLFRKSHASYVQDGHTQRIQIDGPVDRLASVILHDDRKPLDSWFASQQRYATDEARKLRETPVRELSRADRLRRTGWLAPLIVPFYCLIVKGGILDGRAGWHYAMQRTYAEIALALQLSEDDRPAVAPASRQRFRSTTPSSGDGDSMISFPHDLSQIVVTVST